MQVNAWQIDPRRYQIAVLSMLLVVGVAVLEFPIAWLVAVAIFAGALGVQYVGATWCSRMPFDPASALISSLSLCLLLRTQEPWIGLLAGGLAIASKFAIQWRGKHVFNPTNFALLICITAFDQAWIAPGQWGSNAIAAVALAGVGLFVITRASRFDVTVAFLGAYAGGLLARAWWLGDPLAIVGHQLQSGALLIFAFFMISDPRSTPDSRMGRVVFALVAALGALYAQLWCFSPNALIYGLAGAALLTPLLDRLFTGSRYQWYRATRSVPAPRAEAIPCAHPGQSLVLNTTPKVRI